MTPAFSLPVLMITCPGVNALILLNGAVIGESDEGLAIPIRPHGPCHLTVFPLTQPEVGNLLPMTVKLELNDGALMAPLPKGVEAFCDDSGLIELSVSLPLLPPMPAPAVPHAISRVELSAPEGGRYVATLYEENGLRLAVEDPERDIILAHHAIEDLTQGQLSSLAFSAPPLADILLHGTGPSGHRFLLFSARDGYEKAIDDYGRGEVQRGVIYTTAPLGDLYGHQVRHSYRMGENGIHMDTRYGYFTAEKRQLSGAQKCIGLCQCLKLGLFEEAMACLTPTARQALTPGELAEFLGDYHDIRPLYRQREDHVILTLSYPVGENCYHLTHYGFTLKGDLVDNIQEEDPF